MVMHNTDTVTHLGYHIHFPCIFFFFFQSLDVAEEVNNLQILIISVLMLTFQVSRLLMVLLMKSEAILQLV